MSNIWLISDTHFGHENILNFIEKPPIGTSTTPWNHSGMYCFRPMIFDYLERVQPSARGEYESPDAVREMISDKRNLKAFELSGYWRDLAAPDDVREAERLLSATK